MLFKFLKGYSLSNLKIKLSMVYMLNVFDWIGTVILLSTGMFMEANPVMQPFIDDLKVGGFVKIVIPLLLVMYIWFRIKGATETQLKSSNIWVTGCMILYAFICLSHVFWLLSII